ncbi:MAG: hypothetical protein ACYCW6_05265 [Candidatus Xenobia bacterium]
MRKDLFASALLIAALAFGAPATADQAHREVAQITLSKGTVQVYRDNAWRPVRIFTSVRAGEKIQVDNGGQVNMLFFSSKRTEQIHGAVKFLVMVDGAKVDASHVAVRNPPGALTVASGQLGNVVNDQYAVGVRRSLDVPDNLVGYTPQKTLTTTPEFRWSHDEGVDEYHFTLSPGIGEPPMVETDLKDTTFKPDKPLERGKTYAWRVTAGSDEADGLVTVLSDDQTKELQAAQDAFTKAVAQNPDDAEPYLLLAARYEKEGLPYQAIDVVKQLSDRNPKDDFPHKWLSDLYAKVGMLEEAKAELAQVHDDGKAPTDNK